LQEALDTIKKELGPEAIILQTKSYKKGFGLLSKGSVEVTVAISDKALHKKRFVESRLPQNARETLYKMPAYKQSEFTEEFIEKHLAKQLNQVSDRVEVKSVSSRSNEPARLQSVGGQEQVVTASASTTIRTHPRRYVDIVDEENKDSEIQRLESELKQLKRMLQEMKSIQESDWMKSGAKSIPVQHGALSTLALQEMFELLAVAGIEKRLAYEILKTVQFEMDQPSNDLEEVFEKAATVMLEKIKVIQPIVGPRSEKPQVITLLGAPGSGKTSTTAKLAGYISKFKKMKIGLVHYAFDSEVPFDSLLTVAKLLNVPFRAVANAVELPSALGDFQSLDLVLIDVAGFSHRDGKKCSELVESLKDLPNHHCEAVLNSTLRDPENLEVLKLIKNFKINGLIFTHLDHAVSFGSIYNIQQRTGIPLTYLSSGKKIPDDIKEASAEQLVSLILDL
jgi:flagellar biosynthesis protein FlhF